MRNQRLSEDERETRYLRKLFAEGKSLAALCGQFGVSEAVCIEILVGERSIGGKRPAFADDYQTAIDGRFMTNYLSTDGGR